MSELPGAESRHATLRKLLALLPSGRRERAAAVLAHNSAQSRQMLQEIASREQSTRRTHVLVIGTPGMLMVMGAMFSGGNAPVQWFMTFPGLCGLTLLVLAAVMRFPNSLEQTALEILLLDSDKYSLGALLEAERLFRRPVALRQKRKQVLIHLLQNLTEDDTDLLTSAQRDPLHRYLNYQQRDTDLELRLATLTALQHIGDRSCLGVVHQLAAGEAATDTALAVCQAAQDCIEQLHARLDFGSVKQLPAHIGNLIYILQSNSDDLQRYATGMLALRQLLPRLTHVNYHNVLPPQKRDDLYRLLTLTVGSWWPLTSQGRYGSTAMQEEIVRTAQRMCDTRALPALRNIAPLPDPPSAFRRLHQLVQETLPLLEAQAEKEKESQTLLRGSASPVLLAGELLRAAAPSENVTAPAELLRAATPYQREEPVNIDRSPAEAQRIRLPRTEDPHR